MRASPAIFEAEYVLSAYAKSAVAFLGLKTVDVPVHLPTRAEDDRCLCLSAVLEHVERHRHVLERSGGLAHQLVHLGVGGEVDDDVRGRVLHAADASLHRRVVSGQILQQVAKVVRPPVQALVDAEDLMPFAKQSKREVRADLAARSGDENAHRARIPL